MAAIDAIARACRTRVMPAPWAPGLAVAFARWHGPHPAVTDLAAVSDLATGTGADAASAVARALGEMAENLSLGAGSHPQPVPAFGQDGGTIVADARMLTPAGLADPGSEGVGAGETLAHARLAALHERIERAALALWWTGRIEARPAPLSATLLASYRQGNASRRTMIWYLPLLASATVSLVLTDDGDGGRIAMGTGAHTDPVRAADAALREALQAEIAWLAPPHHPDIAHRDALHLALRSRLPGLVAVPAVPMTARRAGRSSPGIEAELARMGMDWGFANLTSAAFGVPVARCVIPGWPLARPILMSLSQANDAGVALSEASCADAIAGGERHAAG